MFENSLIQMALGVLLAVLVFASIAAIKSKCENPNTAPVTVFFAAACILVVPLLLANTSVQSNQKNDELSLVYAIAKEGAPDLAKTLLADLHQDYKPEYTLAAARISAMSGDYQAAKALYLKACTSFPEIESEYDVLVALCESENDYYAVTSETEAQSVYLARAETLADSNKYIASAVKKSIDETEYGTYNKAASYIVYADEAYHAYLYGDALANSDHAKELRKFNRLLEENPWLLEITQIRLARLKLQLLCGDYKEMAGGLDGHSDYNELLIVSELYLSGYVKQSNFTGDYAIESVERLEKVYNKLDNIYNNNYQEKSREERNAAKAQLKSLKTSMKNPALSKIADGLSQYTSEEYAMDASKVYLQMAKIAHSLGNEPNAVAYLDRSIDTVGDCEDIDYTAPMYELVGIITDKDDPERLKDAVVYVDRVLENNMTVKMSSADENSDAENNANSLAGDFTSHMQTYVSQKRMSVNIVNIDTTGFDHDNTIKATVNISNNLYTSVGELKAALSVQDCGIDIDDFTVEKVNYTGANILLCVDTSGSMEGQKIEDLKNAIKLFAMDKADIEDIALITFSSDIENDYPFGISVDALSDAADAIRADGGTAVYRSVLYAMDKFRNDPGMINSIIVMTDGLDGSAASMEMIAESIGKPCKENGITVYTIGFGGDADGTYLNAIAAATGGAYLYANEPTTDSQINQLSAFFNGLRAQILNQYTITFKAKDTLSLSRELKVAVGDGLDSDRAKYRLDGDLDSTDDPDAEGESPVYMSDKVVNGFEPRMLFKNGKTLNATLKGEGFRAEDNISIALKGNTTSVEWDLGTTFVDANSVSVTIPAGIGVDVYDVYVTINGKIAVLPKGLSIFAQASEIVTDFGQYRFVSYIKQEDKENHVVTLSGYVTMNGWLHFNGDIALTGDLNGGSISLSDGEGSYVCYETPNAEGLAVVLANIGLPVSMPAFGQTTLHNNPVYEQQNSDFKVEVAALDRMDFGKYFAVSEIDVKLYPNRATFDAKNITVTLPFADKLLKDGEELFSFDFPFAGSVSSKNIGVKTTFKFPVKNAKEDTYFPVGFGNMPIYISPEELELGIDTLANDYEFKFMVKTAFVAGQKTLGLRVKWNNPDSGKQINAHSNGLVPTDITLYADVDVTTIVAGVPVVYSDFMLRIKDIDTSQSFVNWTLEGGCDVTAAKLSALPGLSGLEKWFGDVSALKLDDARLTLKLGDCYVKAETSLKLFEKLDCGTVLIEMGKFPYECALLNMRDETVGGLRFVGELESDWDFKHGFLKFRVEGEFDAINRFIGIQGRGEIDAEFRVWVISAQASRKGEIAVGIRMTSDGTTAFIVRSNPAMSNGGITWPKNVAGKL